MIYMPEDIIQWFGERGVQLDLYKDGLVYETIERDDDTWLFILDNCQEYSPRFPDNQEVELYSMDSNCCECWDGWRHSGFDWSRSNLESLLPPLEVLEETYQESYGQHRTHGGTI